MLTFLFGVGVIAATLLLIAAALDEALSRGRAERKSAPQILTGSLVSISLARAGAVSAPASDAPPREKKAA